MHFPSAPGVVETRAAIANGDIDVARALAEARERIGAANSTLAAFTLVNDEPPVSADPAMPLAGIAIGVKDLYDTAGMKTAYGSAIYRDHVPAADAALVARLKALGGHVAGKTVTTEFAWRQAGPTVNPWNAAHTPGGSSSGSAAAVAAGLVPLALGTQTFGSVIRPATFCGVVGFKPTYGLLPLDGVKPLSPTLDHGGFFARSVNDIACVFSLLSGETTQMSVGSQPRLRFVRSRYWDQADAAQRTVLEEAVSRLSAGGARVEALELPAEFDDGFAIADVLLCREAAEIYGPLAESHPGLLSTHMKDLVARGKALPDAAYPQALAARVALRARFADEMAGFDAVLTLPALGEAPRLEEGTGNAAPCVLWTLLGAPALTLPQARGANGLPLGLQLVGGAGADSALLSLGGWCARA